MLREESPPRRGRRECFNGATSAGLHARASFPLLSTPRTARAVEHVEPAMALQDTESRSRCHAPDPRSLSRAPLAAPRRRIAPPSSHETSESGAEYGGLVVI